MAWILCVLFTLGISCPAHADSEPSDGEKLFALKVKDLLAEKCNACHGKDPDDVQGELNLLSRESMLRGGESFEGDVVIPGKGEKSWLYITTTRSEDGYEMPPKEAEKLTEEQSWWIRDWINAGAPWPDDERVREIRNQYAEGELVKTSGGLSDDWTNRRYKLEDLWAYRPLKVQPVPKAEHPIDWFLDRKLESVGLEPATEADVVTLARRMSFGLTGLPPNMSDPEIRKIIKLYDQSPKVFAEFMAEHLMNTPQYGEHFGRQWLDVVRYADSAGFANDYARPNAWRYRDYVVRAFNSDKPYNDFVRQQIAGDEIDGKESENLIATGMLRMGPWEQTGMSVFRVTRQQWLDDVTDSVGQTFLAHAMQCCKCHDHKFDPLPTRDYYSMMAVFTTTQFAEPNAAFLESENQNGFEIAQQWTQEKLSGYRKQNSELNAKIKQQKKKENANAKVGDNGLDPGDEASQGRISKNIARHAWELDKTRPIAFSVYTGKTVERNNVKSRLLRPKSPWEKGVIEEDTILTGGDAFSRGDKVTPGPLSAAVALGQMPETSFPRAKGKRRLALADWITADQNPLTARVIVNRVWSWHFGKGIAGNPNNFGATGRHPTHPELLDYLADWFMKNGWSIKHLNRLIVTSAAYQRDSRHPDPKTLDDKDPKRDYYAIFLPRRLTAEEFRDAMLYVSGELNPQVGGIPVRPEINQEVAFQPRQIMGGTASVYEPDPTPMQRNRRTLYAEKLRGLRDPFLETFNQPGPDKSCELRETSTVAPQALTLLNAVVVQARALAFSDRLIREAGDKQGEQNNQAIISAAFRRALGREPSDDERALCMDHWQKETERESGKVYKPREYKTQITRTVMAEKTGEPYDFVELMPAYKGYKPDLQPSQVDARTRGLAQVCLVLFNANEFAYLD